MAINITRRLMLRELFKSDDAIAIYQLHTQFRLPINEIAQIVNELQEKDLVIVEGMKLRPKKELRAWVFRHRNSIFFKNMELSWKKSPEQFLVPSLAIGHLPHQRDRQPKTQVINLDLEE